MNKNEADDDNGKGVYNVSAKKTVTGNQGDKTKDFAFNISVNGAAGENYYYEIIGSDGSEVSHGTLISKAADVKINLKDGQSVKIYGLTATDTYKIEEVSYTADGYKTTIDNAATNTATGTLTQDKDVVVKMKRISTHLQVLSCSTVHISLLPDLQQVSLLSPSAEEDLKKNNTEGH